LTTQIPGTSSTANQFVAEKVTGNYVDIATFNPDNTFSVFTYWKAAACVANDGTSQLDARQTRQGVDYGIYALYTASGTVSKSGSATTFTLVPGTGSLSIYKGPNRDTVFTASERPATPPAPAPLATSGWLAADLWQARAP
jgi:hypothetical protein